MIIVSTGSAGEAREVTELFRTAPAWLDWRIYQLGTEVASSADARTWTEPEKTGPGMGGLTSDENGRRLP